MIDGADVRRFGLCLLFTVTAVLTAGIGIAVSAPQAGVAWDIAFVAQPTNLPLTNYGFREPEGRYVLALTNTGKEQSNGPVTVTLSLPTGEALGEEISSFGWECLSSVGVRIVTCRYNGLVPGLGRTSVLTVPVAVTETGKRTALVTATGGGAPVATTVSRTTQAGAAAPPFGFVDFSSVVSEVSGAPDILAGAHPFALTTILDLPQQELQRGFPEQAVRTLRAVEIDLPPGLVGNPRAAPVCPMLNVIGNSCPVSSQIGTFYANYGQGIFRGSNVFPIYNVTPERGFPAEFGFYDAELRKVLFVYASVRPPAYGVHISLPDIPNVGVANSVATFYGDPQGLDGGVNSSKAFLTNPASCTGVPLVTKIEAEPWEEPGNWTPAESVAPPMTRCDLLQFQPAIAVMPDTALADEPSGYTVNLDVPQSQTEGLEGLATPDLKDVSVTLPQGVSLSAGAGDGLVACSAESIALVSTAPGHCPLASQIGTAEAHTPLLEQPLKGHVYVALPGCGGENQAACADADAANGTLFSLYLELEGSGVVIKQHGTADVNPATGQITASFRDAPQQPFDDLKIHLKEGPRAPLANPQTCGEALTTSDMTPWSSPQTPDATPSWAFNVTGCGEGRPFSPSFEAGSVNSAAGAYTNFTTTLGRTDRQQDISSVQAHLPTGLLASISHVSLCGEPQAERGECPAASRIATVTAAVGAGSHPLTVSGPAYLTGPYNGAPFGLSVPIPAKAGPFNLGTVITRATLSIDPATAAVTVTTNALPQIFDGVPLRLQTVNVLVDQQQFMFNPTNCEAKQVTATIVSAQNATAHVSSPFAAGGCRNLPFNPGFKVATRSPGTKKNGTSFDVKVSSAPGQANIHSVSVSLPKQLPSRLTTIQQACPEATYAANPATCPPGSLVGVAKGITPVLSVPVAGPAYLVSHGGAAFPDIKVILEAEGVRIDLTGSISIKKQITSSTFAGIPDAPITSFDLNFPAGPHSALTTNGNLCAKPLIMPTTIVGQNGRRLVRSTKVTVAGCPKKKPKLKKKRGK